MFQNIHKNLHLHTGKKEGNLIILLVTLESLLNMIVKKTSLHVGKLKKTKGGLKWFSLRVKCVSWT